MCVCIGLDINWHSCYKEYCLLKKKDYTIFLIAAFMFSGILGILLRLHVSNTQPSIPDESHWRITYLIKFYPQGKGARGRVLLPSETGPIRILRENFSRSQMEVIFKEYRYTSRREVFLKARPQKSDFARFEAHVDLIVDEKSKRIPKKPEDLNQEDLFLYLGNEKGISINNKRVKKVLEKFHTNERDVKKLTASIFDYCSKVSKASKEDRKRYGRAVLSSAEGALGHNRATDLGRARAMVALCRASGIPSRVATGFLFSDARTRQPQHWVEVYYKGIWATYDPNFPGARKIKPVYLPLTYENTQLMEFSGAQKLYARTSLKQIVPPSGVSQGKEDSILSVLDFTRLPPKMEDAIALILLLPLGGLITSVFRHVFKVKTFGYFTTTLIALSFTDVSWSTGVVIFVVIVAIGILGRFVLDQINLYKLPRLTLVLLFIVLSLSLTVSILDFLNIRPSSRGVLLPMIALTMMIENFHIRLEESGYRAAFRKLGSTLFAAFCCLLIFRMDHVQWTLLTYPEAEFFIAGFLVLVGRYKREEPGLPAGEAMNEPPREQGGLTGEA